MIVTLVGSMCGYIGHQAKTVWQRKAMLLDPDKNCGSYLGANSSSLWIDPWQPMRKPPPTICAIRKWLGDDAIALHLFDGGLARSSDSWSQPWPWSPLRFGRSSPNLGLQPVCPFPKFWPPADVIRLKQLPSCGVVSAASSEMTPMGVEKMQTAPNRVDYRMSKSCRAFQLAVGAVAGFFAVEMGGPAGGTFFLILVLSCVFCAIAALRPWGWLVPCVVSGILCGALADAHPKGGSLVEQTAATCLNLRSN